MENSASGKTGIDSEIWLIRMKKYTYLIVPSPPKGTGAFVSFETTYEIKKIEDKTNAESIATLCKLAFLFLISTNPVKIKIAVEPLSTA